MKKNIGYAIDIGTTNIDSCLIDLNDGHIQVREGRKNRQSLYGSDVITRIMTVTRNNSLLMALRNLVLEDIADMLVELLDRTGGEAENVVGIAICGNTTMISILLCLDIESLGHYPFKISLDKTVMCHSDELINVPCLDCNVILSCASSAFIGGDILAGMLYIDSRYNFLSLDAAIFIDLGTNGEMVLSVGGKYYSASAACGPAFEGCLKKQGVYGSSALDAVAVGKRTGSIDENGVIAEAFFDSGLDIQGIHIDMDIIRHLMLAKSAIRAGIDTLLYEAGIPAAALCSVYIAGGFGFYLNLVSATELGLFPREFKGKVRVLGNTSLCGAVLLLTEPDAVKKMNGLADGRICQVQLADSDVYKENLIYHMSLKD